MAYFTVQQLKNFVANIPAGANDWVMEWPDGLKIPVADSRTVDAKGVVWIHVRGYVDIDTRGWEPVT